MKVMGHRGARDRALENTISSFKEAIEAGVDAVEFDIHQTKDGVWVVHHDETLERITKTEGLISEKTWDELSQLKTVDGDSIPRLDEVLSLFKFTAIELQIEIKSSGNLRVLGEAILAQISETNFFVISFNHRWLKEVKELFPQIRTFCLLYGLPVNPIQVIRAAFADGISLNISWIDSQIIAECHSAGFLVTVWNANDQVSFNKMLAFGVDYLATDVPFSAKKWKEVASNSSLK